MKKISKKAEKAEMEIRREMQSAAAAYQDELELEIADAELAAEWNAELHRRELEACAKDRRDDNDMKKKKIRIRLPEKGRAKSPNGFMASAATGIADEFILQFIAQSGRLPNKADCAKADALIAKKIAPIKWDHNRIYSHMQYWQGEFAKGKDANKAELEKEKKNGIFKGRGPFYIL